MSLRALSIAVTVVIGVIGALQIADQAVLGLTPRMVAWMAIVSTGLGVLSGFLPRVTGPSTDPETLADRVWSLPPHVREMVARELADRAVRERGGTTGGMATTLITRAPEWLERGR